jgi:hypothetical protein
VNIALIEYDFLEFQLKKMLAAPESMVDVCLVSLDGIVITISGM